MNNSSKAIITSASNKFFPSLLNLLGSIEQNYPDHPDVYIYNLGLFFTFKKELEQIPWVHILEMPHFVPHWRACYTWKTHILNTPLADLNLYIDAGCQVLRPLTPLFEKIDIQDYLAVSQGYEVSLKDITPQDYVKEFKIEHINLKSEVITAGIFGFKKDSSIQNITALMYQAGVHEFCLGFSKTELWKNKGVNKTSYIRDCKMFRHDTTLISIFLYKEIHSLKIEDISLFSGQIENKPEQFIWNLRMNYKTLRYTGPQFLHTGSFNFYILINRVFLQCFLLLKVSSNGIKMSLVKYH